jgi:lipoate-protein ligase B
LEEVDSPFSERFEVVELGVMAYGSALELQRAHHAEVLAGRAARVAHRVLLVEHTATITVTRRPDAASHVLAGESALAAAGVERCETDRGGDVTYHGPGQPVVYPIVDLQRLGMGIHAYIRALEQAAIETCATWGLGCGREQGATGVWTEASPGRPARKLAAIGVRVSRGVTMHGIALNVAPDLSHFGLIVPCGLHGREVTSMRAELGDACPPVGDAGRRLAGEVVRALGASAPPVTRP